MPLKIIFAGTPDFAVPTLKKLASSEHTVVGVYTQPDRHAGRGQQLQASPVKQVAAAHAIPVFQPKTLRDAAVQTALKSLQADVMIVVAYGLILPEAVLSATRFGCINVHPSLLPRWRGAAPIPRSIQAGDTETGVTIMQMDKGMDTGPILKQDKYILAGDESSEKLHDIFSVRGAELIMEILRDLENHATTLVQQNDAKATYAAKIDKKEAVIDWRETAEQIANNIRAFNAWPVANTLFQDAVLKIWEAIDLVETSTLSPGTIVRVEKESFFVATGNGVLQVMSVQLPAKKRISAADFINAHNASLMPGKTKLG